jgi:hypothetical protein
MTAKTILAIFGDTQIGSSTALAPPQFTIHNLDQREQQVVTHNRYQKWLWECWTDYWDYVKELAGMRGKHRKHRIVPVHMGDVIDGNHHGTNQIIQDVDDQMIVALDVLRPIRDMADKMYGIIGTEAHDGPAGANAVALYKELDVDDYGQVLSFEVDGKIHDCAHHGRVGTRTWTSAAAAIGVEVMLDYGSFSLPYPDYIWRAHNHVIDDSGAKLDGTRVICLPSWQLKTAFGHRVAANRVRSDIGGYIVTGGELDASRNRYKGQPDGRRIIQV